MSVEVELETIVTVAIGTGLRRSELCALYWSVLDLERGTISVRRAAENLDGKVIIKATKTKRSQRTDHLPAFVMAALERHKATQLTLKKPVASTFLGMWRERVGLAMDVLRVASSPQKYCPVCALAHCVSACTDSLVCR
jgi:integrase